MPVEVSLAATSLSFGDEHRVAIAVSDYNDHITGKLCDGAVRTLTAAGIESDQILIARVPGAWELPFATQRLLDSRTILGVIALGAVIKGETSHDQHINRAVSMALMQLSLDHNKPVAFGLLTVHSLDQAIHRSGGNKGNKGEECAHALLGCLRLGSALEKHWNGEPE
ncbi:MAG: 6,7-dimethyl-8-ribityllumazine synthase [Planctomycetota bacterium]|jgi:6,7-dimethyl-8-ribityllumazine synthase